MSFFLARTPVELNKVAGLFGTRRIDYVEIDILLTHLLQRMHETGIMVQLLRGRRPWGRHGRPDQDLQPRPPAREA